MANFKFARDPAATNQIKTAYILCGPSSTHAIICSGPLADARIFETLRHLRLLHPFPTHVLSLPNLHATPFR